MRMFTEVGRHVALHSTGVGKALLAQKPDDEVGAILKRTGMARRTPRTITSAARLLAELKTIRARGYAVDDGEQELGVRCVAVTVHDAPTPTAISVSGPAIRLTDKCIAAAAPLLRQTAAKLATQVSQHPTVI
jgi:IclR family acetate operon transcriptional repressor